MSIEKNNSKAKEAAKAYCKEHKHLRNISVKDIKNESNLYIGGVSASNKGTILNSNYNGVYNDNSQTYTYTISTSEVTNDVDVYMGGVCGFNTNVIESSLPETVYLKAMQHFSH